MFEGCSGEAAIKVANEVFVVVARLELNKAAIARDDFGSIYGG